MSLSPRKSVNGGVCVWVWIWVWVRVVEDDGCRIMYVVSVRCGDPGWSSPIMGSEGADRTRKAHISAVGYTAVSP